MNTEYSPAYRQYLESLSKEFLLEVLENCFSEIFVVDDKGQLIYVNPACKRHYGMTSEAMTGKDTQELCLKHDLWEPYTYLNLIEEKKTIVTENLYKTINQNLLSISVPVFDQAGQFRMMVACVQDHFNKYDISYRNSESIVSKNNTESHEIIGKSKAFLHCYSVLKKVSKTNANILLLGESGTGKSILAKKVHVFSNRKDETFFSINCGAIPENLLESELFGYAPNAFTGASSKGKIGLIEKANGGTLFLDEIGELPLGMQVKILDVLENKRFIPVGSNEVRSVDVRIISGTNQNLLNLVQEKKFRADLYYRINTIKVTVPPLRERQEDIILLVNHYLSFFNREYDRRLIISDEALQQIMLYNWPGNVRQLRNCMERLVILSENTIIDKEEVIQYLADEEDYLINTASENISYTQMMEEAERRIILGAYANYKTSRKIAEALSVSQTKANNMIRKYISSKND
ncbi:Anaerobic nitric oxide reductase transcription regulator NorR [Eubacterium callanderi]|uniref:sigma-54 interaction domain-containing protein n=1 Tax=Eubacterium callanderi TaxID=53442 RepID=UPI0029FF0A66|nr:sigma 54-interacting transcriptional regulator [Eubacterium callanderi]WPK69213.1 Anaerobic nitric oxide reductase transcription regulator NorR [Eubacterium callanderi]WPK73511.1 Anaerobic nitric oxide reductase transcription regulator NorR [Eubacterium callanderi]